MASRNEFLDRETRDKTKAMDSLPHGRAPHERWRIHILAQMEEIFSSVNQIEHGYRHKKDRWNLRLLVKTPVAGQQLVCEIERIPRARPGCVRPKQRLQRNPKGVGRGGAVWNAGLECKGWL